MQDIIIQLILGAIGGNGAGAVFKNQSLGTLGNTIAGVVGGGLGGQILGSLMNSPAAADAMATGGNMVTNIAGGGIGGAVLMIIVGVLKGMMNKQA